MCLVFVVRCKKRERLSVSLGRLSNLFYAATLYYDEATPYLIYGVRMLEEVVEAQRTIDGIEGKGHTAKIAGEDAVQSPLQV